MEENGLPGFVSGYSPEELAAVNDFEGEDLPGPFTLLHDAVDKLGPYFTVDDWRSVEQSLLELLWHLADNKVDKTEDGRVIPKTKHRRRALNKDKEKARHLVAQAIDNGVLKKPRDCDQCGRGGMIHGHHEDYSRPLDVIWLCASCHAREHNGEPHTARLIENSKPLPRWSENKIEIGENVRIDEYQRRANNVRVEVRRRRGRREMSDQTAISPPASANGDAKLEGKVKWYNESRGFGFIGREGHPDVFIHVSALKKAGLPEIKEGDPVRFRVETTKRGLQAADIELVIGA